MSKITSSTLLRSVLSAPSFSFLLFLSFTAAEKDFKVSLAWLLSENLLYDSSDSLCLLAFFLFKICWSVCVCVYVCRLCVCTGVWDHECAHKCRHPQRPEIMDSPGVGIAGIMILPVVLGLQLWYPWRSAISPACLLVLKNVTWYSVLLFLLDLFIYFTGRISLCNSSDCSGTPFVD